MVLPGPLRLTPSFPFAGRSAELAALRTLLPRAEGEGRRVALVGGEPGSGKSRLVREFAHDAAAGDVLVLYGACDAVVRTPYGPFVEALDYLVRLTDPETLRDDLGTGGGELTRMLPDLPRHVAGLPAPVSADQDTERHRLHTAAAELLASVSRRRPVLLVLEDGHWADAPTLLLLRHLARTAIDARMLLVATFRDTEADLPAELSQALADLRRSEGVARLRLTGLSAEEIAEFVRQAADGDLGPELPVVARAIADLTEGNAFLMTELWRTLVETDALTLVEGTMRLARPLSELGSPESVREVVSQRLARLARGTAQLLELAAIAGPEFDLDVLRRAAADQGELAGALDEAVRSGMIEEIPGRGLVYRFTHELVRRALYDRLTGIQRAELHLLVGEALEGASASGRNLADLAHHFAAAAPIGGPERAVEYNLRAARAAIAVLAFEEAAAGLRTAIELGVGSERREAEVLLELGTATFRAGASLDSLDSFRAAAEIARRIDDAEILARAAIGLENTCWRPGMPDQGALELLDEASAALGDGDSELRVGVLAGLTRAHAFIGNHERAAVVRDSAVAMARRLDDRRSLATVLTRSYWSRGSNTLDEVLEMLTEGCSLAEEIGDIDLEAEAMEWRIAALIALSDLASAQREVARVMEMAVRLRQPFILHVCEHYQSVLALCDGRLGEAEAAAERSHDWSRLLTGRDASGVYGIQMFSVRREQGRLAELAPVIRVLAADEPRTASWRPGLAALLVELGMEDEARRELAMLRAEGLDPLRQALWLASLTYLVDACAAVGDAELAALLYPELEPHAGTNVMVGHGVACYGAADRYLGMLAVTLGEHERAEGHFERAMELNRRMGATTWLAHTAHEYARMLVQRGAAADVPRAAALRDEAEALAERIGLAGLLGRIRAPGSVTARATTLPDGLSSREAEILRLVAQGLSNRDIGRRLFISEHTVANHIRSILRKTGSGNRTEAVSYAFRNGIVDR